MGRLVLLGVLISAVLSRGDPPTFPQMRAGDESLDALDIRTGAGEVEEEEDGTFGRSWGAGTHLDAAESFLETAVRAASATPSAQDGVHISRPRRLDSAAAWEDIRDLRFHRRQYVPFSRRGYGVDRSRQRAAVELIQIANAMQEKEEASRGKAQSGAVAGEDFVGAAMSAVSAAAPALGALGGVAAMGATNALSGQVETVIGDYLYMCLCQTDPMDAEGNSISPYDAVPLCPTEPQAQRCYIQRYVQNPPVEVPPPPPAPNITQEMLLAQQQVPVATGTLRVVNGTAPAAAVGAVSAVGTNATGGTPAPTPASTGNGTSLLEPASLLDATGGAGSQFGLSLSDVREIRNDVALAAADWVMNEETRSAEPDDELP